MSRTIGICQRNNYSNRGASQLSRQIWATLFTESGNKRAGKRGCMTLSTCNDSLLRTGGDQCPVRLSTSPVSQQDRERTGAGCRGEDSHVRFRRGLQITPVLHETTLVMVKVGMRRQLEQLVLLIDFVNPLIDELTPNHDLHGENTERIHVFVLQNFHNILIAGPLFVPVALNDTRFCRATTTHQSTERRTVHRFRPERKNP